MLLKNLKNKIVFKKVGYSMSNIAFFRQKTNVRAFTLIETMVGVVIIVTAITGPLSVAVSSATYAKDTKDKMTAIYLAQEAVEILRFERDSLLIKCSQNNSAICPLINLNASYGIDSFETISNAAWRIFKDNLNASPSCFITAGSGCTFDFYSFTKNTSLPPVKYSDVDPSCDYLYRDDAIGSVTGGAYLCSANGSGLTFKKTKFNRVIRLERIDTVSGGSQYYKDYNDDVRVNVKVSYSKPSGFKRTVEVVDFLHAKI